MGGKREERMRKRIEKESEKDRRERIECVEKGREKGEIEEAGRR